ncbi:hypothetical protein DPEC_G00095210 [Dallia pectoralis]|uniref:Uncharacterized protein n=1 Tax=Dallia pectoralis TaxID=75939 RepID=A0ACC2GVR5_DALPE|nr:hypothetical protein DPEC_G00095210 [Dallia pectoralis]
MFNYINMFLFRQSCSAVDLVHMLLTLHADSRFKYMEQMDPEVVKNADTEGFSGERRPSVVRLQGMLKKVSQSPFNKCYKTNVSSTPESRDSSFNEIHVKQITLPFDLQITPPFDPQDLGDVGADPKNQDVEVLHDLSLAAIVTPPLEFQNSQQDFKPDQQQADDYLPSTLFKQETHTLKTESKGLSTDLFTANTYAHLTRSSKSRDIFEIPDVSQKTPRKGDPQFQAPPTNGGDQFQAPPTNGGDQCHAQAFKKDDLFQDPHTQRSDLLRAPYTKGGDLFTASPTNGNDLLRAPYTKGGDLFTASPTNSTDLLRAPYTKGGDLFTGSPTNSTDLLRAPYTKGGDLFTASPTNSTDLFNSLSTQGGDLFSDHTAELDHLFSVPVTRRDVFFKSPITRGDDLFAPSLTNQQHLFHSTPLETPNPFQATPSGSHDPFQTPSVVTSDIFQQPSRSGDMFQSSSNDIFPNASFVAGSEQSTPFFPTLSGQNADVFSGSDFQKTAELFNASLSNANFSNVVTPSDKHCDIILTTPLGSEFEVAPATPTAHLNGTLQATALSHLQNGSVQMRTANRPPKPTPRKIQPKLLSQTEAVQPAPKLAQRTSQLKNLTQDNQSEQLIDSAVYEDILFTGQERCVEDWPEDSPEHDPEWKPSGKLRLRRESMLIKASTNGDFADEEYGIGKYDKSKRKTFKMSFLSRRGSKNASADNLKDRDDSALRRRSEEKSSESKDTEDNRFRRWSEEGILDKAFAKNGEEVFSEDEDKENAMGHGKTKSSKYHFPVFQQSRSKEGDDITPKEAGLFSSWEDGDKQIGVEDCKQVSGMHEISAEEDDAHAGPGRFKREKLIKMKFVPGRGLAIIRSKSSKEPKGDRGHTPHRESTKHLEKSYDDTNGACGYSPNQETKDLDEDFVERGTGSYCAKEMKENNPHEMQDYKMEKPFKFKGIRRNHRKSSDGVLDRDVFKKGAAHQSVGQMEKDEPNVMDYKPKKSIFKKQFANRRKSVPIQHGNSGIVTERFTPRRQSNESFKGIETPLRQSDLFSEHGNKDGYEDDITAYSKQNQETSGGMPGYSSGATSSDYNFSEAAEAEWRSAQMDENLSDGFVSEEPEGDTDSLMEWWNTVEQWDELPSDNENIMTKEAETRSFTQLAEKVRRGLRVFNKLFTERAEVLWQYVILLNGFADDIANFHKKAKIGTITGGTTAAIGGGAAIVGLALAPFTLGTSLIITAVGVGVAAAGGITSASASISDNVNNMNERKKVEVVLEHYQKTMEESRRALSFVCEGLYRLRAHTLLRAGTQHYSGDWEVRRAVQMISLVEKPVLRAAALTEEASVALSSLFKGMDRYFTKDTRELKKGLKNEASSKIRQVAQLLHEGLMELNGIREELQDGCGNA